MCARMQKKTITKDIFYVGKITTTLVIFYNVLKMLTCFYLLTAAEHM